jgi:4-hydroxy-tetrahydrodipicolinate synthase
MKKIISASVTPFAEDGSVDIDSALKLYNFNIDRGVDGFFIFGSMGEWPLLADDEKDALAQAACESVGDKAQILLGIHSTGMAGIQRNMERWSSLPNNPRWVIVPPGSWAGPKCPVKYVHAIADASDRPVYFYYVPGFNGVTVSPAEFRDILSHPRVAGVKNSSGSISMRKELVLLRRRMDFELYEGDEWGIDEALIEGCDGAVAGFASVGCKLMKRIANEVEAGNYRSAHELQFRLIDLYHSVYGPENAW